MIRFGLYDEYFVSNFFLIMPEGIENRAASVFCIRRKKMFDDVKIFNIFFDESVWQPAYAS